MRLLFIILILFATSAAQAEVCVLNYERMKSPVTKAVKKAFRNAQSVIVKNMAMPLDIADCVKRGATEIVIIAHALETKESEAQNSPVPLAYFRSLTGNERSADIERSVMKIDQQIMLLKENGDAKNARKLERHRKKLLSYPEDRDYIKIFPILPRAIALASRELKNTEVVKLRKIRLLSCVPEQVLAYYKDLSEMVREHNIELDIAPKNRIMSLLRGKTVTSPDLNWLRQSIPNVQ